VLRTSSTVLACGVKRGFGVEAPDPGFEDMADCLCLDMTEGKRLQVREVELVAQMVDRV
jgi:hypothetical protein